MKFPSPYEHVLPHEIQLDLPSDFSRDSVADRFVGSIVGLAAGDALGASVEFRPHQFFTDHPVRDMEGGGTWGLKAGQWTDDTSMALCLASSLITKHDYDPYDQMVRYKWWYKHGYMSSTGSCFDIGNATRDSLEEFVRRQKSLINRFHCREDELDNLSWDEIKSRNAFDVNCSTAGVAGNGALMRLAPVPLFFYRYPDIAVEYAGRSGRLTHGDQKAVDACRYYAALIVAAVNGESKDNLLSRNFYESHRKWFGSTDLHPDILRVAKGSYKNPNGYDGGIRGKGYIVNALEAALWAFWSDNGSFEKGALAAVNLGDDTDTTAAIYGQLAGAFYGYKSIPKKWREKLYAHELLVSIGQWLYSEGKQFDLKKKGQKMMSTEQTPGISPLGQYQGSNAYRSPTHLSETSPSQMHESKDKELLRHRQEAPNVMMRYQDSNQTRKYQTGEETISSRQSGSRQPTDYRVDVNNPRMRDQNTGQSLTNPPDIHWSLSNQPDSSRSRMHQANLNHLPSSQVDTFQTSEYQPGLSQSLKQRSDHKGLSRRESDIYSSLGYQSIVNPLRMSQPGHKPYLAHRSNADHSVIHLTEEGSANRDFSYPIYGTGRTRVLSPRSTSYLTNKDNHRYPATVEHHHPKTPTYLSNDVDHATDYLTGNKFSASSYNYPSNMYPHNSASYGTYQYYKR